MEWKTIVEGPLTIIYPEHDILPHNLTHSAQCACEVDVSVTGPPTHFTITHKLMMQEEIVITPVEHDEAPE